MADPQVIEAIRLQSKRMEEEDSRKEAVEKARYERARARWVMRYGSERLKTAKKMGYNHNGLYVRERAAWEHLGYTVDLQDNAKWDAIENPTLEHMKQAKTERAQLVWLMAPAMDMKPAYDDYDEWEASPALVIENYLSKWTLIKKL